MPRLALAADVASAVRGVSAQLSGVVSLLAGGVSATEASEIIASIEEAGRLVDAARVLAVVPLADDHLVAERMGFASPAAAVASLARVTERTATLRLLLAKSVRPATSVSGAPVPPRHEHVATALAAGQLGVEAAVSVVRELEGVAARIPEPARRACEAMMVNLACGLDPTGDSAAAPVSVDYVTREIRQLSAAIDPDGAAPREERAVRGRSVRVGRQNADGLIPIGGMVLPEVGGLLVQLVEAWRRSPRFEDAESVGSDDARTPDQRRHDAFAEILMAAAAAEGAPRLNGRPVSVLVTVAASELHREGGLDSDPIGTMSGSEFPVSRAQVERFIDAAGYRQVEFASSGAIVGMRSPERCFTGAQASAIAARDGERCFAPGCTSPHTALQVHHVVPWREGGPTSTSNGVLLCYWHHRRVDDGPWQYRMVNGLPEARGPGIPEWRRQSELPRPGWAA